MVLFSGSALASRISSRRCSVPRAACVRLCVADSVGDEERRLGAGRGERRRGRASARERNDGRPRQALEVDLDARIAPDRRGRLDRDGHDDPLGVLGAEVEARHLTHTDAVEKNRRPLEQSRHGRIEAELIDRALAQPAAAVQPVDKGEAGDEHGQREQSDLRVACLGFHAFSSRVGPAAAL